MDISLGKRKLICDDDSPIKVSTDESPEKLSAPLEFKQSENVPAVSYQQKVGPSSEWQRSSEGFNCVSKQQGVSSKIVRRLNKDWTRLGEDWSKVKGVNTIANDSAKSKPLVHSKGILKQTTRLETVRDADQVDVDASSSDDETLTRAPGAVPDNREEVLTPPIELSASPCAQRTVKPTTLSACGVFSLKKQAFDESDESSQSISTPRSPEMRNELCKEEPENRVTCDVECSAAVPQSLGVEKKFKVNDWVETVKSRLTTPVKINANDKDVTTHDSAKKRRRKFVKNGWAEKLNKLVEREKSTIAYWNHSKRKKPAAGVTRMLELKVSSISSYCGLSLASACCVSSDGSALNLQTDNTTVGVIFSNSVVSRRNIVDGTSVRIYPSWQTLKMKPSGHVVMCTNFCETLPSITRAELPLENVVCLTDPLGCDLNRVDNLLTADSRCAQRTLACWRCPCQTDSTVPLESCPAHQHSATISGICSQLAANVQPPITSMHSHETFLHTEGGFCLFSSSQPCQSMLESIDKRGGSIAIAVEFCAVVQRVFKRLVSGLSSQSSDLQQSILLQDGCGFLCELIVPKDSAICPQWSSLLSSGIGHVWMFTGIRVEARLTRSRHVRLFSIIDSVWRKEAIINVVDIDSQEDSVSDLYQGECTHQTVEALPPSFCYLLSTVSVSESSCRMLDSKMLSGVFTSPTCAETIQSVLVNGCVGRATFIGKVVHIMVCGANVQLLYVADLALLQDPNVIDCYVIIHVTSDAFVSSVELNNSTDYVFIFKDIFQQAGKLYFDEYSHVEETDSHNSWRGSWSLARRLSVISSCSSDVNRLVLVSGCIVGVDESTAAISSECEACGSNQLVNHLLSNSVHCADCDGHFTSVVFKMILDVFMSVNEYFVCIKLAESTIESLLPSAKVDKVFDVQSILGHCLTSVTCRVTAVYTSRDRHVIHVSRDSVHYELDEISLN